MPSGSRYYDREREDSIPFRDLADMRNEMKHMREEMRDQRLDRMARDEELDRLRGEVNSAKTEQQASNAMLLRKLKGLRQEMRHTYNNSHPSFQQQPQQPPDSIMQEKMEQYNRSLLRLQEHQGRNDVKWSDRLQGIEQSINSLGFHVTRLRDPPVDRNMPIETVQMKDQIKSLRKDFQSHIAALYAPILAS